MKRLLNYLVVFVAIVGLALGVNNVDAQQVNDTKRTEKVEKNEYLAAFDAFKNLGIFNFFTAPPAEDSEKEVKEVQNVEIKVRYVDEQDKNLVDSFTYTQPLGSETTISALPKEGYKAKNDTYTLKFDGNTKEYKFVYTKVEKEETGKEVEESEPKEDVKKDASEVKPARPVLPKTAGNSVSKECEASKVYYASGYFNYGGGAQLKLIDKGTDRLVKLVTIPGTKTSYPKAEYTIYDKNGNVVTDCSGKRWEKVPLSSYDSVFNVLPGEYTIKEDKPTYGFHPADEQEGLKFVIYNTNKRDDVVFHTSKTGPVGSVEVQTNIIDGNYNTSPNIEYKIYDENGNEALNYYNDVDADLSTNWSSSKAIKEELKPGKYKIKITKFDEYDNSSIKKFGLVGSAEKTFEIEKDGDAKIVKFDIERNYYVYIDPTNIYTKTGSEIDTGEVEYYDINGNKLDKGYEKIFDEYIENMSESEKEINRNHIIQELINAKVIDKDEGLSLKELYIKYAKYNGLYEQYKNRGIIFIGNNFNDIKEGKFDPIIVKQVTRPDGYEFADEPQLNININIDELQNIWGSAEFKTSIKYFSLEASTIDDNNNKLKNVTYKLINNKTKEETLIDSKDSDVSKMDTLEIGDYSIKQVSVPEGYILSSKEQEFKIDGTKDLIEVEFKVEKAPVIEKQSLTIKAIEVGTTTELTDGVYALYQDGKLVKENINVGEVTDLEVGKEYEVKEVTAPKGYDPATNTSQKITIEKDATKNIFKFENAKTKPVIEKQSLTIKAIEVGTTTELKDGVYALYQDGKLVKENINVGDIADLEVGKEYEVKEVTAPKGYDPATNTPQKITIEKDEAKNIVKFENAKTKPTKDGKVDVTVKDKDGKPVEGVDVIVKDKDGKEVGKATTDSEGKAEIPGLEDGDYTVSVDSKDKDIEFDPKDITVKDGKVDPIDFNEKVKEPAKDGKVDVTVKDKDGNPLEGVDVIVKDKDGKEVGKATTDSEGKAEIPGLEDGDYTVSVDPKDKDIEFEPKEVPATIKDGKTNPIEFNEKVKEPTKDGKVDVTVKDKDGKPVEGVDLIFKDKDGKEVGKATTDSEGKVEIPATIKLSAQNEWKYQWQGLLKQKNNQDIEYTVEEVLTNDDYRIEYLPTETGFEIENTINYLPTSIHKSVQKVWQDNNNQQKQRPTSIDVQLYADGKAYGEVVKLSEANNWSYSWNTLNKDNYGKEIKYSVKELNIPKAYIVQYSGDSTKFVITNTITPKPDEPNETPKGKKPTEKEKQPVHKANKVLPKTGQDPTGLMITSILATITLIGSGLYKLRDRV